MVKWYLFIFSFIFYFLSHKPFIIFLLEGNLSVMIGTCGSSLLYMFNASRMWSQLLTLASTAFRNNLLSSTREFIDTRVHRSALPVALIILHGSSLWSQALGGLGFVTYCCHILLSHTVVTYCCHLLLSHTVVTYCCHLLLSHTVVTYCCHILLSHTVVNHEISAAVKFGKFQLRVMTLCWHFYQPAVVVCEAQTVESILQMCPVYHSW